MKKYGFNFYTLSTTQSACVDLMFNAIDAGNVVDFVTWLDMWENVTAKIYAHPLNQCGHKLSVEIEQFANENGVEIKY